MKFSIIFLVPAVRTSMSVFKFPDPQTHEFPEWVLVDDYFYYAKDVVCFGAELTVGNLKSAYRAGIFPWHIEGIPLPWYCPERRAVLDFDDLHVPKSLEKERRKNAFTYTIDNDFLQVIESCSKVVRTGEKGTWITPEFIDVYCSLHAKGMAHSVEVWDADGDLIDHVKKRGATWLDVQVMTPHFRTLGAKEISRKHFLRKLKETQGFELNLFKPSAAKRVSR